MSPTQRTLPLIVLALPLLAPQCGPIGSPDVEVRFEPADAVVSVGSFVEVDLVADLGEAELQAFHVDVLASPTELAAWSAEPHPEFDDDGTLFVTPSLDGGTGILRDIVDLRHGALAASGEVRLARIRILAHSLGTGSVSVESVGLAGPDGVEIEGAPQEATITVVP